MSKKKPGKQRWRESALPTDKEIQNGRRGFGSAIAERIESLADNAGLFPLFVGPRTVGASTVPRCYLFFSKDSFQRGEENLACIDSSASNTRLIVRPFGRGKNRVTLLSDKWRSRFQISDHPDWHHIILNTSDNNWNIAMQVMREIRSGYQESFDIS